MINRILAPTDLSEPSKIGLRYALELARDLAAEVTVYYVVNDQEFLNESGTEPGRDGTQERDQNQPLSRILEKYEAILSRFLGKNFSELIPSVRLREKVEIGIPDMSIVERASKETADLIVISTHGKRGATFLPGSVTEKVVRNAPCPVISLHPEKVKRSAATTER